MSRIIRRCPACGNLGITAVLSKETAGQLLIDRGLVPNSRGSPWQHIAYWCARCDTPWVESWPRADVGARRQLVGLPADLLDIVEEGGKK